MSTAESLRSTAESLIEKAKRLEAGEELCSHHWSGAPGWECYCTGCNKHILELRDSDEIPLKKDAYCYECQKSPEQKRTEKKAKEKAKEISERTQLKQLREKYDE